VRQLFGLICIIFIPFNCFAINDSTNTTNQINKYPSHMFENILGNKLRITMQNGDTLSCKFNFVKNDTIVVECNDGKIAHISILDIKKAIILNKPKNSKAFMHIIISLGILLVVVLLTQPTS